MSASTSTHSHAPRGGWAVDLLLLAALVTAVYVPRLADLSIRGEESRWAQVAYEMIQTGDWLVPRQQGVVFADRPPLHSWAIAATSLVVGDVNLLSVRLPSVLFVMLTSLLIYAYTRQFLSRVGALAAGAAYATMLHVLELGRLGETDATLALLMSGSLLGWHTGYMRRWPAALTWSLGGALAALAALTKGPQAPVYFAGGTVMYLILSRDWRFLFSWAHALGWCVFAAVLGTWLVPFTLAQDAGTVASIWTEGGHIAGRFMYRTYGEAWARRSSYPFELFGAVLPWSLALLFYARRDFRQSLGGARPYVRFLATCCLVAFPTCWLPAYSVPRYFMALYPCVACLVGVVIEHGWARRREVRWQRGWGFGMAGLAVALGVLAIVLATGSLLPGEAGPSLTLSAFHGLLFACLAVMLGLLAVWASSLDDERRVRVGILTLAGALGLLCAGPITDHLIRFSVDTEDAVAKVQDELPRGQKLVSFGPIHHRFAYYFRDPITSLPWPTTASDLDPDTSYFCFELPRSGVPSLPFAWERVAVVSCDRKRRLTPLDAVIVGRRTNATARAPQATNTMPH